MKNKGFTLIELLVVIAVIGILASVILASLNSARSKARDARRISDLRQVQTALELYRSDNADYPSEIMNTGTEWSTRIKALLVDPGYLAAVPIDPNTTSPTVTRYLYYSDYTSSITCDGLNFNAYEYVLSFNLEGSATHPAVKDSTSTSYTKCMPGPFK